MTTPLCSNRKFRSLAWVGAVLLKCVSVLGVGADDLEFIEKVVKPSTASPMRADHWAYQPIQTKPPPTVGRVDWPAKAVDAFILARLEEEELTPAPEADAAVLCRRLYFDLLGLPPTPTQLSAFQRAARINRPAAVAGLVDELLASPRYGERWARHWFDVVRFAESVTLRGFVFPEAWRYRDYVIDAFNRDLPFDEFLREQIAGDLLASDSVVERQRHLIAATFLALGNTNLEEQDKRQLDMDVVDEQLDVLGKVFLGQALGCARCHDHKFDPIPTRDYYALAGILASTRLLEHANVSKWLERPLPLPDAEEAWWHSREEHGAQLTARIESLKAELKQFPASNSTNSVPSVRALDLPGVVVDDAAAAAVGDWRASTHNPVAQDALPKPADREAEVKGLLQNLEAERQKWVAGPRRPKVMAPVEAKPVDLPVHRRGSVHSLGDVVPRGVLTGALRIPVEPMPPEASGRRQLAEWLTRADNPLTARVFVNRVWHWLFGAGLVRSVDNFGTTGDPPSHPALLDYLARRFMEEGWSVKWLIRELAQSRTYQQSGRLDSGEANVDPENRLWGYYPRRRLEAECLRDAMLAISGELNLAVPVGPTFDRSREADFGFTTAEPLRSVYLPVFRNALPEMLTVFDLADPSMVVGARHHSTVAPQALFLMNHPFVRERARVTARKWALEKTPTPERLDEVFQTLLGRPPTSGEQALAEQSLKSAADLVEGWVDLVHALFSSLDFRYLN